MCMYNLILWIIILHKFQITFFVFLINDLFFFQSSRANLMMEDSGYIENMVLNDYNIFQQKGFTKFQSL